jgi:hypothetical protein
MKDLPNPAYAVIFIFLACLLALASLFSHSANAQAVITMAASIITGAFGYIQGVSAGKNSLQVPMNPDSPPSTVTVTPQAAIPKVP